MRALTPTCRRFDAGRKAASSCLRGIRRRSSVDPTPCWSGRVAPGPRCLRLPRRLPRPPGTSRAARVQAGVVLCRQDTRRWGAHGALPRRAHAHRRRHGWERSGRLVPLDQTVAFDDGTTESRTWRVRRTTAHDYAATLSDAEGEVSAPGERQQLPPALSAAAARRVHGPVALSPTRRPNGAEPCDRDGARHSVGASGGDDHASGLVVCSTTGVPELGRSRCLTPPGGPPAGHAEHGRATDPRRRPVARRRHRRRVGERPLHRLCEDEVRRAQCAGRKMRLDLGMLRGRQAVVEVIPEPADRGFAVDWSGARDMLAADGSVMEDR
jgi:hypothetical protein